jgi:hypothetical protein
MALEAIARPIGPPGGATGDEKTRVYDVSMVLTTLSDEALLAGLDAICGEGRRVLARLLLHLIEVDERRLVGMGFREKESRGALEIVFARDSTSDAAPPIELRRRCSSATRRTAVAWSAHALATSRRRARASSAVEDTARSRGA